MNHMTPSQNPYQLMNSQDASVAAMGEMMMEEMDAKAEKIVKTPFDMKGMISLTEDLTAALEQESMLLKEGRIQEVEPLRKKKEQLAAALDVQKKRLNQNPSVVQGLDEKAKALLEKTVQRFTAAALENKHRIEAARTVNQRIFSMIGKAAQKVHQHTPYTVLGKTAAAPKHAVAIKINETI